jgi:hypothetical protein
VSEDSTTDDSLEQTPDPSEQTPEQRRALFRVIRGGPDDAEVAALTAVLAAAASSAAASSGDDRDDRGRSVWVDRAAMMRGPLQVGPGAWRNSTWPR